MLPIVYINLASDTKRRTRMEAEFARVELTGMRLPATRWTELDALEQSRLYSADLNQRTFHKTLANGEKGCYASHLYAWQYLQASDHPALIVLEDDVVLRPDFAAVIEAIGALALNQAPDSGWDMIKLMGRSDSRPGARTGSVRPLIRGYELFSYCRIPSFTAGYVISRNGAQKLLASRIPFGRPVDVDLRYSWENSLRILGLSPAAIHIDPRSNVSTLNLAAPTRGIPGLAERWKKFRLKARYNLLNLLRGR